MMKRVLAMFLIAVMLLGLAACGDKPNNDASNTDKPTSSKTTATSSEETMTSSKPEEDTRYRATREEKPAGFKYKEASILVIGDSITAGDGTPSGYRYSLFEKLYASGAKFKFVGPSKSTGDIRLISKYNSHGGVGGRKIEDITSNVDTLCNFEYDIVLVMIGRNDSANLSGVTDRYKTMLEAIIAKNPEATVYCGEAPPQRGQYANDSVNINLNKHLPSICEEFTKKGHKVNYVSMKANEWQDGFYNDVVHPSEAGNRFIATQYWDAILDEVLMINDSGDSSYVEPVHVESLALSDSKLDLVVSTSKSVTATVKPDKAEIKNVLWSSSNTNIAKVNDTGKITAVKLGKATIIAKTLDGNIEKTIEVNVIESNEPASTEVFKSTFSAADWTGSTDKLGSSFSTNWGSCAETPTITSLSEVNAGNNFKLSFNYKVSGNGDRDSDVTRGNYSKISYNGYEIRIYNCTRGIELFNNGQSIGFYTPPSSSQDKNTYILRVNNGKATLTFNGEEIIAASASGSGSKKVELKIGDLYRCCEFSNLVISKY